MEAGAVSVWLWAASFEYCSLPFLSAARLGAPVTSKLPGGATGLHELWGASWGGERKPPLHASVAVAREADGELSARVRKPINLDAHAQSLASCLIDEAQPVRSQDWEGEGGTRLFPSLSSYPSRNAVVVLERLRGSGFSFMYLFHSSCAYPLLQTLKFSIEAEGRYKRLEPVYGRSGHTLVTCAGLCVCVAVCSDASHPVPCIVHHSNNAKAISRALLHEARNQPVPQVRGGTAVCKGDGKRRSWQQKQSHSTLCVILLSCRF